jgi:hypothetical protein
MWISLDTKPLHWPAPCPQAACYPFYRKRVLRFVDVPSLSHSEPSTSWRVVGKEIKLDLLVPSSRQNKPYQTVAIRELGAHAIALEHLEYLLADSMDAVAIGKSQLVPVRVPMASQILLAQTGSVTTSTSNIFCKIQQGFGSGSLSGRMFGI